MNDPAAYLIRATQGHSIQSLDPEKILVRLTPSHPLFPKSGYVVHGTYNSAWEKIQASGGLKQMTRTHIHFATDLPKKLPALSETTAPHRTSRRRDNTATRKTSDDPEKSGMGDDDTVISGMRQDCTILIWVDVLDSLQRGGITWWRSANGVILTSGLDKLLPLEWVKWVERRGVGDILHGTKPEGFDLKKDNPKVIEAANKETAEKNMAAGEDGIAELAVTDKEVVDQKTTHIEEVKTFRKDGEGVELKDNWDDD